MLKMELKNILMLMFLMIFQFVNQYPILADWKNPTIMDEQEIMARYWIQPVSLQLFDVSSLSSLFESSNNINRRSEIEKPISPTNSKNFSTTNAQPPTIQFSTNNQSYPLDFNQSNEYQDFLNATFNQTYEPIICRKNSLKIECPKHHQIKMNNASFIRTENNCSIFNNTQMNNTDSCNSSQSTIKAIILDECLGERYCSIENERLFAKDIQPTCFNDHSFNLVLSFQCLLVESRFKNALQP